MYASGVLLSRLSDAQAGETARVLAAQRGDRAALGVLYENYARMVHGVLLAHVPWSEAEDLVQDVFVTAMERIQSLREPAAFGGWLCTIARNIATDHHRKQRPTVEIADREDRRGRQNLEALAVLEQIQKLPEAYRETLVLRLVEGMTGPEIAARTGLTAESVRVNLCRGMKLLRDALEIGNV